MKESRSVHTTHSSELCPCNAQSETVAAFILLQTCIQASAGGEDFRGRACCSKGGTSLRSSFSVGIAQRCFVIALVPALEQSQCGFWREADAAPATGRRPTLASSTAPAVDTVRVLGWEDVVALIVASPANRK